MNFINIIGILFALALLIPNVKFPLEMDTPLTFSRGAMLVSFYVSLFLLCVNLGILEPETNYETLFWVWAFLGAHLSGGYVVCYLYAHRTHKPLFRALLPVIAFLLFLASGILLGHLLFYPFALLYAASVIPRIFRKDNDKAAATDNQTNETTKEENEPKGTDEA